jgi:hypothetical protein
LINGQTSKQALNLAEETSKLGWKIKDSDQIYNDAFKANFGPLRKEPIYY